MGILRIAPEIYETPIMDLTLYWLRSECTATVSKPEKLFYFYQYKIEGTGIPKGDVFFSVKIQEIVPKVLSITIE